MIEHYLNKITLGDSREHLARLPNQSINLIFTDPIYDRESDYLWLAGEAKRLLKPAGLILFWSNGRWHKNNVDWMEQSGLVYRWDFACIHHAGLSPMNGKIIAKTNRLIWFDLAGDSKMIDYLPDGYLSLSWLGKGRPNEHKWTKNPKYTSMAIRAFCEEGGVILDPFAGGGTNLVSALETNRQFIGFEIDSHVYQIAVRRIAAAQPPLMVGISQKPQQSTLFGDNDHEI